MSFKRSVPPPWLCLPSSVTRRYRSGPPADEPGVTCGKVIVFSKRASHAHKSPGSTSEDLKRSE